MRIPKAVARALGQTRLASLFPVHSIDVRACPAVLSLLAATAIAAVCFQTFDTRPLPPPLERSILVTVVEREPVLDDPHRTAAIPIEPRPVAAPAEVPPPPVPTTAETELPTLRVSLARHTEEVPFTPARLTLPEDPDAFVRPPDGEAAADFWRQVRRRIAAHSVYPPAAVRRNATGRVILRVRIGSRGELLEAVVAESSGDTALDRAAVSAVRAAAPFPPPGFTGGAATDRLKSLIPVRFELVDEPAHRPLAPRQ